MKIRFSQLVGLLFLGAVFAFGFYACKKNRFKKEDFLENLYDFKIQPEISEAVSSLGLVRNAWDTYSTETTTANFTEFKADLSGFNNQMEGLTFYNLGDVGATYVFSRVYKTKIDTTEIINDYNSQETFVGTDVSGYANTRKGIYVIEYLLYSPTFQDSLELPKFINFVDAHLDHVERTLEEFGSSWEIYRKNFIASNEGGVDDSYNIVINRIIHVLEDIIIKRIGKPLEENDPSLGVGYYADRSLNNIKLQVSQLDEVYNGVGTTEFNSVYNNVRKKNKKLADEINTTFDDVIALGAGLSNELTHYVENDHSALQNYNARLNDLLKLFKTDVQKELDIIITFGDTDGD